MLASKKLAITEDIFAWEQYCFDREESTIQVKADFFIVMSNNQERVFCQALEKTQRLTPNKLVAFSDTVFFAINDTQILIAVGEQ